MIPFLPLRHKVGFRPLLAIGVGGAAAAVAVAGWGRNPAEIIAATRELLAAAGIAGPMLFALLQIAVALSGVIPASLLGIAAGAIYGLWAGFALAAVGSLAGALLAFGLSRSLLRASVERLVARHRRLRGLDRSLTRRGWLLVCLLRLSPVMPFSATSFLLGLSSVRPRDYLIGTLACLPALFAYVLIGTAADAGAAALGAGESPLRWLLLGIGVAATLLLVVRLGQLALRRELDIGWEAEAARGAAS